MKVYLFQVVQCNYRIYKREALKKATRKIVQIPVNEVYLGRVLNALTKPIDT